MGAMSWIPSLPMQAAPSAGGPDLFLPMMLGIGLIWYFMVIRPQNQRQREHEGSLKAAKKGDHVVTAGGLHGKVVSVGEDDLGVEIGKVKGGGAVTVQVSKARIESIGTADSGEEKSLEKADDKSSKKGKEMADKASSKVVESETANASQPESVIQRIIKTVKGGIGS
jgi:preprotein translocase subunit YajC